MYYFPSIDRIMETGGRLELSLCVEAGTSLHIECFIANTCFGKLPALLAKLGLVNHTGIIMEPSQSRQGSPTWLRQL